jgi:cobalt-zinc-cadmium efflux system protein
MGFGHHHHHHHDHGHAHDHGHGHFDCERPDDHPTILSKRHMRALKWVFILTVVYLVVEIAGGLMTGSLALLADGFHMFADATAIGISLFAAWMAHRPAPDQKTFGYQRIEILAALFNAALLVGMSIFIVLESYERFQSPVPIKADTMMLIATGGMIVNILAAWLLHGDMHSNMNIRGAYLHVLGDLLGSIGAIAAGGLILFFHWNWADPLISVLISLLVLYSAVGLMRDSVNVLLEGCPAHINVEDIRAAMLGFDGVEAVHHLHVWNINLQRIVLTAHLVVQPGAFTGEMLSQVQESLKTRFGLSHVTPQLELS